MAHHNVTSNGTQPAFIGVRPVHYSNMPRRDLPPMAPEELMYGNIAKPPREAQIHAVDAQEWLARQKAIDLHSLRPEIKRELLAQNEEMRKNLVEHDAYFIANQEYLRLMNDEPSRQTFREKQRLTEDLEKQKRLLIEDLARDQQLKQDKYKRNQTPTYPNDIRALQYLNEKAIMRGEMPLRVASGEIGEKSSHPLPSPRVPDPRYPLQFASAEEMYRYRHLHESMMMDSKGPVPHPTRHLAEPRAEYRHCLHSDFNGQSLMPIIQEKEKKIIEMKEKIMRLEQEERMHKKNSISKLEASKEQQRHLQQHHHNQQQHQQQLQQTQQHQPIKSTFSTPTPQNSVVTTKQEKTELVTDNNNNDSQQFHDSEDVNKQFKSNSVSPKSPVDKLIIDMNDAKGHATKDSPDLIAESSQITEENVRVRSSPCETSRNQSEGSTTESLTDGVRTEVIDDDKSFNELKYNNSNKDDFVEVSSVVESGFPYSTKEANENLKDDSSNTELENLVDGNGVKYQKKPRKLTKTIQKKEDSNQQTQDFQEAQNRLALDLPKYNWLEERLKQQKKLTEGEIVANSPKLSINTSDEKRENSTEQTNVKEENNEIKINEHKDSENNSKLQSNEMFSKQIKTEVTADDEPMTLNKASTIDERDDTQDIHKIDKNNIPVDENLQLKSQKPPPRSELLLKMLDPNNSNPQITSPSRINPPTNTSAPTTISSTASETRAQSLDEQWLRKEQEASKNQSLVVMNNRHSERIPSAPPLLTSMESHVMKHESPFKEFTHSKSVDHAQTSDNHKPEFVSSPTQMKGEPPYQEVRPNLVVERRKDSTEALPYMPSPKHHSYYAVQGSDNSSYSKFIVEERYNRKRPIDEANTRQHQDTAAQKRADFSQKFFMDLERGMATDERISSDKKEKRMSSESPTHFPRNLEELSPRERLAKLDAAPNEYNYLSRFKESSSQPLLPYKSSGEPPIKSPAHHANKPIPSSEVPGAFLKRSGSTSPAYRRPPSTAVEEKLSVEKNMYAIHDRRRIPLPDGIPGSVVNGRLEGHFAPLHSDAADPILLRHIQQSRERELKFYEEARKREEIHRTVEMRKDRLFPPIPVTKPANFKALPMPGTVPEEYSYNDRVRTVEDLRALQMGYPIDSNLRRYIRPPQVMRNERLTEREKNALREANIINQTSIRHEALTPRQPIHGNFMEHPRRKGAGLTSPRVPSRTPPHVLSEEQMRLASYRRQKEEEDKIRAHMSSEPRESYITHKEVSSFYFNVVFIMFLELELYLSVYERNSLNRRLSPQEGVIYNDAKTKIKQPQY